MWKLQVLEKGIPLSWLPFEDLKDSSPVEVVEHSKTRDVNGETEFVWRVPCALMKRDTITASVSTRARNTSHECDTEVPASVEYHDEIDAKNGNDFWRKTVEKEMRAAGEEFEIIDDKGMVPYG